MNARHLTRRLLAGVLLLLLGAAAAPPGASGANTVTLSTASGYAGDTTQVTVSLANDEPVGALQVQLQLPQGVTLAGDAATAGRATAAHSVTAATDPNGRLTLVLYSLTNAALAPGQGPVATFSLTLGGEPALSSMPTEVTLASPAGTALQAQHPPMRIDVLGASMKIATTRYDLGRVALAESRDVAVGVSNPGSDPLVITGLSCRNADFALAEAPVTIAPRSQGSVTVRYAPTHRGPVADNMEMESNSLSGRTPIDMAGTAFARNVAYLVGATGTAGEAVTLSVRVRNYDPIVGFTLGVRLPQGLSYVARSAALTARATDHALVENVKNETTTDGNGNTLGNGQTVTFTGYSLANTPLGGHDGDLLTFQARVQTRNQCNVNLTQALLAALLEGVATDVCSASYGGSVSVLSPVIALPQSLDFGLTPVTGASTASINVSNRGNAPLTLTAVEAQEIEASCTAPLPLTLQPGQSASLPCSLTTMEEEPQQGRLRLLSNDPETPISYVSLKGQRYYPNTLHGEVGDDGCALISLSNTKPIAGVQFAVHYNPEEVAAVTATAAADVAQDLRVSSLATPTPGVTQVVAYTFGEALQPGDSPVIRLALTAASPDPQLMAPMAAATAGGTELTIDGIVLSGDDLRSRYTGPSELRLSGVPTGVPTGLEAPVFDPSESHAPLYDLQGRPLAPGHRGPALAPGRKILLP